MRKNNNEITKRDQKMFDDVRFYVMTGYLSNIGLIYCNGVNKYNQKRWKLSERGEKIAELLEGVMNIYYEKGGKENGKKKGKGNSAR
jgi:hypothetical protein